MAADPAAVGLIPASHEPIWRGPLVPVALAATAGILLDRWFSLPLTWTFLAIVVSIIACLGFTWRHQASAAIVTLWFAAAALAGAYHHWHRDIQSPDDIGHFATLEPQPVLLRGVVETEPLLIKRGGQAELRSFPTKDGGRFNLVVTAIQQRTNWQAASGRVQVHAAAPRGDLRVGDEVEIAGRITAPAPPANPGEFDYAELMRDQRIRATLSVKDSGDSVFVLQHGSDFTLDRVLARVRVYGQQVLADYLPAERQGVAIALLLGDGAPMTQDEWEKYLRTGVIHVLAISGQHLVVLAGFLAIGLRVLRVRLRHAALVTALFLLAYALLVGGRPPVMRSAAAVCCLAGALLVRRPLARANTFALAWLIVLVLTPTDIFSMGCQLSFLAVAVLMWGTSGWLREERDPLQQLAYDARPLWQQGGMWLGRYIAVSYAVTLAIWVVLAPLVAARQNVLAPVGVLIGPLTVLLTSVALLSGFALLFFALVFPPLAHVAAWITDWSLAGCDVLVTSAATWPGACWFVPRVPEWWLWIFYPGVLALLMLQTLRRLWTWGALALLLVLTSGLSSGAFRAPTGEFRCTFLAVGHGGCAVLETPDGKTLLYDVGSLTGPEVVRRHVAPYLWYRGIRRIDEVFLSHADLDHFNGLAALLDRFAVGQVSCTPTFQERQTPAVARTLQELKRWRVPIRILSAGQQLRAGEVSISVLHPPLNGPHGNENARSLVLLLRHAGHTILLTGDLEGAGLERVQELTAPQIDVMMAPHHGNRQATAAMTEWAKPRLVVSCQGPSRSVVAKETTPNGPPLLGTWLHGAVVIHSQPQALVVETYLGKHQWRLQ